MNQQLKTYLYEQSRAVDDDFRRAIEACGGNIAAALEPL